MKEKVSKYFMAGTDEEVLIGDVINVDLVKDFEDGRTLTRSVELKITEETIPFALEMGIIETEENEQDELLDFDDEEEKEEYVNRQSFQEFTTCVAQDIEEIRDILNAHLRRIEALEKKNASPKKK